MGRRRLTEAIAALLLLGFLAMALPAVGQSMGQEGKPNLSPLAACVEERGALSVLMVFDESGSLKSGPNGTPGTDPDNRRIDAAKALLNALENLARGSSDVAAPSVELAIAGFERDYVLRFGWSRVDAESRPKLEANIDSFATRNTGIDTDFALAMRGIQRDLARRSAERLASGSPACMAAVLLTDGDYSIQRRSVSQFKSYAPYADISTDTGVMDAIARGESTLCDGGGTVDQIRRDGVFLITVALSRDISATYQNFIQGFSERTSGPSPCGTLSPNGAHFSSPDSDELVRVFDEIGSLLQDGSLYPYGQAVAIPCVPAPPCVRAEFSFEVDPALSKLHILAEASATEGIAIEVVASSGQGAFKAQPNDAPGATDLAGVRATYAWLAPGALVIDLEPPAESASASSPWRGIWKVRFWDESGQNPGLTGDAQIFVFGGLQPQFVAPKRLVRGEATQIVVAVVDDAGSPAPLSTDLRTVTLVGEAVDPETGESDLLEFVPEGDRFFASYTPGDDLEASALNLSATLNVTLHLDAGELTLTPVTRYKVIALRLPEDYPQILQTSVDFGAVALRGRDETNAAAELVVRGGNSDGCVWFSLGADLSAPDGVKVGGLDTSPPAQSPDACIPVEAGSTRRVQVSLALKGKDSGNRNGAVTGGPLVAHLTSESTSREDRQSLPIKLAVYVPPRKALLLGILALMLALGVLAPLGVAHLANSRAARFNPSDMLRLANVAITITADGVWRQATTANPAVPLTSINPDEFTNFPGSDLPERALTSSPLMFEARTARSPLSPPHGMATAAGRLLVSGTDTGTVAEKVAVPLELNGVWVLVLEPSYDERQEDVSASEPLDGRTSGELILITDSPLDHADRMTDDARQALPVAHQSIRAALSQQHAEGSPTSSREGSELSASESDDEWFRRR